MPFPDNAKYVTFREADLNGDGWINQSDYNLINSENSEDFKLLYEKLSLQ